MNSFLVVLRHECDDIPLAMFADKAAALECAFNVTEQSDEPAKFILGIDASTPLNVSLYEFRDGVFVAHECVKVFDEE